MNDLKGDKIGHIGEHLQDSLIKIVIDLLLLSAPRPGDTIDIIRAEHESGRLGIKEKEFCRGMAQLLESGLIELQGNAFCLTLAGFDALKRAK